jgi:hypothetical protein
MNANNWSDLKKVKWHLQHGDGFKTNKTYVTFQGRDYLGYAQYTLTKEIRKLLKDYEKLLAPSK